MYLFVKDDQVAEVSPTFLEEISPSDPFTAIKFNALGGQKGTFVQVERVVDSEVGSKNVPI